MRLHNDGFVPKSKSLLCALLLLIVIVLIQTDSIEAKGGFGRGSIARSSSRSSSHGSARGGQSKAGWFSSGVGYSGHSSHPRSRSIGSPRTYSSLSLIAAGVVTTVFLDAGRRSSYGPSDVII